MRVITFLTQERDSHGYLLVLDKFILDGFFVRKISKLYFSFFTLKLSRVKFSDDLHLNYFLKKIIKMQIFLVLRDI